MIESSLFIDYLLLIDSSLQVLTTDRSSLANELFDPVGIPGTDAAPSADHSKVDGTYPPKTGETPASCWIY